MVHVHAHEFIGEVAAHVAGVLQGVLHGLGAMVQAELDAGGEGVGDFPAHVWGEALVNHIAAQGERQAVVLFAPPHAKVFAHDQALVAVGQLPFVNDEAHVGVAVFNAAKIWSKGTTT